MDNEIKKTMRVLIGMHRPTRTEVLAMLSNRQVAVFAGYFWCRCFDPNIAAAYGSYEDHYLAGHYDEPVYKWVYEEGGKVIESLNDPGLGDDN